MGDVGADGFLVIPVEDNAGAGLIDYAGHGAVGLADSQNRDHRGEVFEQLAGQSGTVFRLLAERENQKGGILLLADGIVVALIAKVNEVVLQARGTDRGNDFRVGLAGQADPQHLPELRVGGAFLRQDLPDHIGIAVGGEQAGVGHIEISVRLHHLVEIILVETIGDQLHRRVGHCLELVLDKRGDSHHHIRIVKHFALQKPVFAPSPGGQA